MDSYRLTGRSTQGRFHSGIAQHASDDFRTAVVAIEARLGDENANFSMSHDEVSPAIGWSRAVAERREDDDVGASFGGVRPLVSVLTELSRPLGQ
jgi:hypothetical protein